ncbi:putative RNA-binding Zn ribbon-like protein [Kribbella amoyensis]|uniref:Putative RNA-binding Zn ribbon-like protein n=1 Tax=Kribbella amoyensis TaxID=996641 RepID=A0A561BLA9_9ACTN|nr:CGNR zinc finger domain-containing protein [Kribbella amoyensis]TWD79572.1 putative RNA-binding Zn ribbon-like protein [Kribbella amoyensis]
MSKVVRSDEDLLLTLLNSSPLLDGEPRDELRGPGAGAWLRTHEIPGTPRTSRELRDAIAAVVRGEARPTTLQHYLHAVRQIPVLTEEGVQWKTIGGGIGARAVLAWAALGDRLRACENDQECRLFLIDRSKPNTRRWCSMKTCGNRLKARRHHEKLKSPTD